VAVSGAVFFSQLFKPWLYIWIYSGLTMRMAVIALEAAPSTARNELRGATQLGSPAPRLRASHR
jgi:hypothetical protein